MLLMTYTHVVREKKKHISSMSMNIKSNFMSLGFLRETRLNEKKERTVHSIGQRHEDCSFFSLINVVIYLNYPMIIESKWHLSLEDVFKIARKVM